MSVIILSVEEIVVTDVVKVVFVVILAVAVVLVVVVLSPSIISTWSKKKLACELKLFSLEKSILTYSRYKNYKLTNWIKIK